VSPGRGPSRQRADRVQHSFFSAPLPFVHHPDILFPTTIPRSSFDFPSSFSLSLRTPIFGPSIEFEDRTVFFSVLSFSPPPVRVWVWVGFFFFFFVFFCGGWGFFFVLVFVWFGLCCGCFLCGFFLFGGGFAFFFFVFWGSAFSPERLFLVLPKGGFPVPSTC